MDIEAESTKRQPEETLTQAKKKVMAIEAEAQKRQPEVTSPPRDRKKRKQQQEEQLALGDDNPQVKCTT
jgi:hypothetical protein